MARMTSLYERVPKRKREGANGAEEEMQFGLMTMVRSKRDRAGCDNTECNGRNCFVIDHHQGDSICKLCGAVQLERMLVAEPEQRVFSDDTADERNAKTRGEVGQARTTNVGRVELRAAHRQMQSGVIGDELLDLLARYTDFRATTAASAGRVVEVEPATLNSMAAHTGKIHESINLLMDKMGLSRAVQRLAQTHATRLGMQCLVHDMECSCLSTCRLRSVKRVPPVLTAAVLTRQAFANETGELPLFEVYQSAITSLGVTPTMAGKMGAASFLISDACKGMPFPCARDFDSSAPLVNFFEKCDVGGGSPASLGSVCEGLGLSYPDQLRAKEIMDGWQADKPAIMPQSLMGVALMRMLEETNNKQLDRKDIAKAVGITPAVIAKHETNRSMPWPTKILEELIKHQMLCVQPGVATRAREQLRSWLLTSHVAFPAYTWTRERPLLSAACALLEAQRLDDACNGVDTHPNEQDGAMPHAPALSKAISDVIYERRTEGTNDTTSEDEMREEKEAIQCEVLEAMRLHPRLAKAWA